MAIGDVVDDRYSVSGILAVGGFSCVYEARAVDTGEPVALKVARTALREGATRRFAREAAVLKRVSNAHLPRLRGTGHTDDVVPYIALELLEGCAISRTLTPRPPSIAFSVEVCRELLRGLHAVHCEGVVHCDVKPSNLFLHRWREGGRSVKLIDFGICRLAGQREPSDHAGSPGTPSFMSPEQLQGRVLDARTDLYATGMVLQSSFRTVSRFCQCEV